MNIKVQRKDFFWNKQKGLVLIICLLLVLCQSYGTGNTKTRTYDTSQVFPGSCQASLSRLDIHVLSIPFLISRHRFQGSHFLHQHRALFHSSAFNKACTFSYLLQQMVWHCKINDWQYKQRCSPSTSNASWNLCFIVCSHIQYLEKINTSNNS